MKVLHILYECRPSGAEVMLRLAAPFWTAYGCELEIITIGNEEGDYAVALKQAGYTLTHLPLKRSPLSLLLWSLKFRSAVKEINPDLVVNHNETIHTAIETLTLGIPKAQFRIVHNCFCFSPALRRRKYFERAFSRLLGVKQVAISPAVQKTEWDQYRNATILLENWFDSEHFRPPTAVERIDARRTLNIPPECKVLVTVGNGSIVKNYRVIIETLAIIPPEKTILYFQVGREHPEREDRLLAEMLGQSHRVRFCGPYEDVRPFLWAADLYLMPSQFEGFALSTAEAIACGTPCILSDILGLEHFKQLGSQIRFCRANAECIIHLFNELAAFDATSAPKRDPSASDIVRNRFGLEAGALRYFRAWMDSVSAPP